MDINVGVQQDFRIAVLPKPMPLELKIFPEFLEAIYLTVKDDYYRFLGVSHRLVASWGRVDDAESPMS